MCTRGRPSLHAHGTLAAAAAAAAAAGRVSKWTNYVTGWQDRWLVLRNGYLSYFRSKNEETICRGTVELAIAFVQKHEFDDLRLDVQVPPIPLFLGSIARPAS